MLPLLTRSLCRRQPLLLAALVITCAHLAFFASSATSQRDVDVVMCRLEIVTPISTLMFTLSPTTLSNAFELQLSQLFSGLNVVTASCFDESMSLLFQGGFSYVVDSSGEDAILANLEVPSPESGAIPVVTTIALEEDFSILVTASETDTAFAVESLDDMGASLDTFTCSASASCSGSIHPDAATVTIQLENGDGESQSNVDITVDDPYELFNQDPLILTLQSRASALASGDATTIDLIFADNDVSNVTNAAELVSIEFSIDEVDGSGNVLVAGGGTSCPSSWLNNGGSLTAMEMSLGYQGNTLSIPFTTSGSGSARNCRISAEVTDWQGRSVTQSVTVVVDAASTLNVPTATNTSAPVVLPLVFVRSGQQGSFIIYTPDKCHDVVCASATQCLLAEVCDSSTGECLDAVPTPDVACDDADATTTNDTCTLQGVCVGSQKCGVVECVPDSTCHIAGTCVPETGLCTPSVLKEADADCDDEIDTTVFDTCDAVGTCSGVDVSELTLLDVMDFTTLAGTNPVLIKQALNAMPDVCCESAFCCEPCDGSACLDSVEYDTLFFLQS